MKQYTKKTIEVYDRLGAKYLSNIANAQPDEIELFMKELPAGGKVLDVGCSGGRDSKIFADNGFKVTGIDLCKPFLIEARERVPDGVFLEKDLLELDFEAESFDGIWACAVLLHLEKTDVPKALKGFYNILKSDGTMFIGVKQGEGEKQVIDSLSDGNSRYFSFFEKDEIEGLVEGAGFRVVYSEIREDAAGREGVWWIRVIGKKAHSL